MQQNATTHAYTNQESVGLPPYSYCVLEIFRISYHTDWSKVRFFTHPTISPVERHKDTSFFETYSSLGYVFYYSQGFTCHHSPRIVLLMPLRYNSFYFHHEDMNFTTNATKIAM